MLIRMEVKLIYQKNKSKEEKKGKEKQDINEAYEWYKCVTWAYKQNEIEGQLKCVSISPASVCDYQGDSGNQIYCWR